MSASVSLTQPGSSALDEETARAGCMACCLQLYYAPPSPELLSALRVAVTEAPMEGGFLQEPWRQLVAAARALDDAAIAADIRPPVWRRGQAEVFVYASHYLAGFLNEKPWHVCAPAWIAWGFARGDTMPRPR